MKKTTKAQQTKARARRRTRPTRAYTRGLTAKKDGSSREFKITSIPAAFWIQVQAKAKREGVSIRGKVLTHLQKWLDAR